MAFRATLKRSMDFTMKFNGILNSKPEVQDYLRLQFGHRLGLIFMDDYTAYETVEAHVRSGPHKGDGAHPSASKDTSLHSTLDLWVAKTRNGEKKFYKTIHLYHDEDEYKEAENKVKEVNKWMHGVNQESARLRKAQAAEAKLEAEEAAKQASGEQPKDNAAAPKA